MRTEAECSTVADAVAAADTLRLVGVAGYEGEVPDASPETVRAWLRRLTALAVDFDKASRFADLDEIVVSAGGSAWFDAVAEVFAELPELSAPVLKLLRSGAYVSHDDGHYKHLTPFNRVPEEGALHPAFRLWAQVVSRPTPSRRSRTRASATRRTTSTCPRRRSCGTPVRRGAPGHRRDGDRAFRPARLGAHGPGARTWRWATGSAWACRTRARPSTSGS